MSSHLVYLIIGVVCLIAGSGGSRGGATPSRSSSASFGSSPSCCNSICRRHTIQARRQDPERGQPRSVLAVPVFVIILLFSVRERG